MLTLFMLFLTIPISMLLFCLAVRIAEGDTKLDYSNTESNILKSIFWMSCIPVVNIVFSLLFLLISLKDVLYKIHVENIIRFLLIKLFGFHK